MTLPAAIRTFFAKYSVSRCRIVAAASGGVDSSALLLALGDLRRDGFEIVCAHVNHHLRGEESQGDEAFVRDLCARLAVPLHVADGSLSDDAVRDRGIEGAARAVRYERLIAIRDETGSRLVATAHQKNDQAETVLMRLLTGTGLAGLRGIHPMRNDGIIRPLLEVTRGEIESFLNDRDVKPREDLSNRDPRFVRNRIRKALRKVDAVDALTAIAEQAQTCWPILEHLLDEAEPGLVTTTSESARFHAWPADPWLGRALLNRHIRRLDPASRNVSSRDIARLAEQAPTLQRVTVTPSLELVRDREAIVLRRPPVPAEPFELSAYAGSRTDIPPLRMTLQIASAGPDPVPGRQRFLLPEGAGGRFVVRNRRAGDRFQPLGLQRSKKLKDFLIDRRIPAELRDRIPLLLWNDEIIWVAGVEISERFKVIEGGSGVLFEVWTEEWGAEDDHGDQPGLHG